MCIIRRVCDYFYKIFKKYDKKLKNSKKLIAKIESMLYNGTVFEI